MDVPSPVEGALDGESVAASVSLGDSDALYVTPTRTLVYRGESLLSDASVEEYRHDAQRVTVTEGRRKASVELDYGLDGTRSFTVPSGRLDAALHPVLAGVLNAAGVTDPGETITRTYRFSELTLVVTSARVLKHVGGAVWDDEYEGVAYEAVTGLDVEEGQVASQLVLETGDRTMRTKVPNDYARDAFEHVETALLAYHDVSTYEAFERLVADDADEADDATEGSVDAEVNFEPGGVDPIETGGGAASDDGADAGADAAGSDDPVDVSDGADADAGDAADSAPGAGSASSAPDGAAGEAASANGDGDGPAASTVERLRDLNDALERQQELLDEQQTLVEALAEELEREREREPDADR